MLTTRTLGFSVTKTYKERKFEYQDNTATNMSEFKARLLKNKLPNVRVNTSE